MCRVHRAQLQLLRGEWAEAERNALQVGADLDANRIDYAAGQSFSNLPSEIHLARNEGSVDLVVYASYFVPAGTTGLRIDQPSPGAECPQ